MAALQAKWELLPMAYPPASVMPDLQCPLRVMLLRDRTAASGQGGVVPARG